MADRLADKGREKRAGVFFERSHGGTATIDPLKHTLFVHGLVKNARKFSMKDVRRFPSVSRILFIECSGNGLTEWSKPRMKTVQGTHGLTSCSEWTGAPLSTILNEAGVKKQLQELNLDPQPGTPEQAVALLGSDIKRWNDVIVRAKIPRQ